MPNSLSYFWPAQDLEAVSLPQNLVAPGKLILNGTYSSSAPTVSFANKGFARQVSLTSANNLSAAIFVVSGVQNTTLVVSTINGPNNGTVVTPDYFDIVSSIAVSQPVNGIKAGTGLQGAFNLFSMGKESNLVSPYPSGNAFALGFNNGLTAGSDYTIYQSLTNLISNGQTYLDLINNFSLIQKGTTSNLTQIIQSSDVCYNILVQVSAISNSSKLTMQFLKL